MKIGKYIFSENSTNYINNENNFDLMSIVDLIFGFLLSIAVSITFIVAMLVILEGCI